MYHELFLLKLLTKCYLIAVTFHMFVGTIGILLVTSNVFFFIAIEVFLDFDFVY